MTPVNDSHRPDHLEIRFKAALGALVPKRAKIVAAVSGGPDSMALLHLLLAVREERALDLVAAHLDHGLRGAEGVRDLEAVRTAAGKLGVTFVYDHVDCRRLRRVRSMSIEEAARLARYDFLERTRQEAGFDWIATGHTADDQAESVLINLLRGSGPKGLAGMSPLLGRIIRPMLEIRRREIMAYLEAKQESYVQDSTNQDLTLTRNRVRLDLLPKLEQDYNPELKIALVKTAQILRDEEAYWDRAVETAKSRVGFRLDEEGMRLNRADLAGLDRALARRLVRAAVAQLTGSTKALGFDHVEAVLAMAADGDIKALDLPRAIRVRRDKKHLFLGHVGEVRTHDYQYPLPAPGLVEIPEIGRWIRADFMEGASRDDPKKTGPDRVLLDATQVTMPLTVRSPRPGDRFHPFGMAGRKKLSDFFIDTKVPVRQRSATPLVVDGRDHIIWVAGHRPAHPVRIQENTTKIIQLQVGQASSLSP